jgi:predicted transcriptional regulator
MSLTIKNKRFPKQVEVARELGCSPSSISMAVTGYRKGRAQKKLLKKIDEALRSKLRAA